MITVIIIIFALGYIGIALEEFIKINKTAFALLAGVLTWAVYILFSADKDLVSEELMEKLGEFSGILFFLMGAMAIVEIIDTHDGFHIITKRITQTNKRKLLWIVSGITFLLSPVLDNLTTAIVMISLLQKLVKDPRDQLYFAGMIVIAANAGGAWSPIGDVTTTMLWVGKQITAFNIIKAVLLPSIISLLVPLLIVTRKLKGNIASEAAAYQSNPALTENQQLFVLGSGILGLILVPVFKTITHLPPFMGILIGLSIMWIIAEIIGGSKEKNARYHLSPAYALRKIDSPSILFFLGILLCIATLEKTGILSGLAIAMDKGIGNKQVIVASMGLLSSVVDNVPLMAAAQGMYPLSQYPIDNPLWEFLAYCTGTGGSLLIIGSAAGVAVMGMVNVKFVWYLRNISWIALLGYLAGAAVFILQQHI